MAKNPFVEFSVYEAYNNAATFDVILRKVSNLFCFCFLNQLCGCHHLPVLLRLCAAHLCHIPQRLLRVSTNNHTQYTEHLSVAFLAWTCFLSLLELLSSFYIGQSQRSCSPTSHRWMSQMRVTSTFLPPSLPLGERR